MKRFSLLFVTALLGALVTVLAGGPAQAHSTCVHHGNDFGCANSTHDRISACDYERDGHAVYTEGGVLVEGIKYSVTDRNGADAGCGVRSAFRFTHIRVCEDIPGYTDSCTAWTRV
jgi:hypothetical protein